MRSLTTKAEIVNRVCSLPPGARKYIDIAKMTNHLIVDMNKFYFYVLFRWHIFVTKFLLF